MELKAAYEKVVTNVRRMTHEMMRDIIKEAMSVQLLKIKLGYERSFEFPDSACDVVTDVVESGEEETGLDSDGNVQFKVGNDGELLWSEDMTEEENYLLPYVNGSPNSGRMRLHLSLLLPQ